MLLEASRIVPIRINNKPTGSVFIKANNLITTKTQATGTYARIGRRINFLELEN
jgi:hypothetical protein